MKRGQLYLALVIALCSLSLRSNSQSATNSGMSSVASGGSTSGASVLGKVKFDGTLPKTEPIRMQSDPACAKEHAQPMHSEEIVAGADGTLENVIVFVSQGLENRSFEVPHAAALMQQKGCMYEPHVVALRAGQTLRVVNSDNTTHNIHPQPANNREWNKAQIPGQPIEDTFAREEVSIPVKCNIHPWMRSYIAVFKHPYFSVTGKDGTFDLANLPPGEYTIEAWQEKLGTLTQHVRVGQGENKTIEFVFKPKG
jgi:plastocyanin